MSRLGVSADILPYSQQEILDADFRFNRFVLGTASLAGQGLLLGAVGSLFFLRKTPVVFYGMGFGIGTSVFHELFK